MSELYAISTSLEPPKSIYEIPFLSTTCMPVPSRRLSITSLIRPLSDTDIDATKAIGSKDSANITGLLASMPEFDGSSTIPFKISLASCGRADSANPRPIFTSGCSRISDSLIILPRFTFARNALFAGTADTYLSSPPPQETNITESAAISTNNIEIFLI